MCITRVKGHPLVGALTLASPTLPQHDPHTALCERTARLAFLGGVRAEEKLLRSELHIRVQLSDGKTPNPHKRHPWLTLCAQAADYEGGDPTGGFVNYLSYQAATNAGLVKVTNNQVYLGVDYSKKISTSAQGRDSIRMESKERFDTGLLIADIAHMPGSQCGIWPA